MWVYLGCYGGSGVCISGGCILIRRCWVLVSSFSVNVNNLLGKEKYWYNINCRFLRNEFR